MTLGIPAFSVPGNGQSLSIKHNGYFTTFCIYVTAFDGAWSSFKLNTVKSFTTSLISTILFPFHYEVVSDRLLSTSQPIYIYFF